MPLSSKTWIGIALSCALLVGCSSGLDSEPIDSSRIVTLSGDLTEIAYELGLGDNVVGVDVTTVAPAEALEVPIVGVGRFITAEGVLSVDPTLVLGDDQSSPIDALSLIEEAGVAVETTKVPTSFEELYEKIEQLGELLGKGPEASQLVDRINRDVESAADSATDLGLRVAYLYTRGPDVMLLFGSGMTTQPLIEAAGAIDAGAESGIEGSVAVSAEALIAADPDVIIVPKEGLSIFGGVDAFVEHPMVSETKAGRTGSVLVYPEGDFLTFGPRIAESLRLLIEDLAKVSG